jgi:hypothetical protein
MAKSNTKAVRYALVERKSVSLPLDPTDGDLNNLDAKGQVTSISKAFFDTIPGASRQDSMLGRKEHPFSFSQCEKFKLLNVHHSACIDAKKEATIGLGFFRAPVLEEVEIHEAPETEEREKDRQASLESDKLKAKAKPKSVSGKSLKKAMDPSGNPLMGKPGTKVKQPAMDPLTGKPKRELRSKVARTLDPLCKRSFQDVLSRVAEDFFEKGIGYMEVVRDKGGLTPIAIYHCPAKNVFVYLEDTDGNYHYEVEASDGSSFVRKFAEYGDLRRVKAKFGNAAEESIRKPGRPSNTQKTVRPTMTELVAFVRPTSRSKFYGFPDWLACMLAIELKYMSTRYLYDFFLNRGCPEVLISVVGTTVDDTTWKNFVNKLKSNIGLGNSHKTQAFNFPEQEAKVEVHKLASEGQSEDLFTQLADVLASEVVSAHGVPPLLAGIQIPGKLGASNELANALQAFQALRINPAQEVFETTLVNTLGRDFSEISEEEWELRSIMEELDVNQMATVGGMRQPISEAKAEGRDLDEGMKD